MFFGCLLYGSRGGAEVLLRAKVINRLDLVKDQVKDLVRALWISDLNQ
jgi:hypothetical protein